MLSYAEFKQAGSLMPTLYDESVLRRWGVDITIGSPLISVSILVPEYIEASIKKPMNVKFKEITTNEANTEKLLKKILEIPKQGKKVEPEIKIHENDDQYYKLKRRKRDESGKKLMYKNLKQEHLSMPIRLQILLDSNTTVFNERSNPQCVHWSSVKGEWSRVGCRTDIEENWFDKYSDSPILVNCTCNHLSTFAVLVDIIDLEYIPEPSLLENIYSYSCFSVSLPLLLATYLILALIRGMQTNSNTIRKNLVICIFLAELVYFIALKVRRPLIATEVS